MLKILKNMQKKDIISIILVIGLIALQVYLELKIPDYMSTITSLVQTEGSKMHDIILNGSYMLQCAFGSLVSAVATGYIISKLSSNFSLNIREKLFDKVQNLSMNEIKKFQTSSLITRTTNDVTQVEMIISMGLQMLIKAPITAIWAIAKILNKSWQWSAITAVAVLILLIMITILVTIVMPKFKKVQKLTDQINNKTRENIKGIRVIRAFNAEKYQEDKFEKTNNELTDIQLFTQKAMSFMSPIMYLIMYGLTLAIYFVGAYIIKEAQMIDKLPLFTDMVVFSSYAMQIVMSFLMLSMIFMIYPRASVSIKRINEVLETENTIKEGTKNIKETEIKGEVEFKNVSFKYPGADEYVLENISFVAKNGETVAFIGSTGSGKSTLINLVPRFYDATEGEILIDGINVKEYTEESLYNKLGYIPQKAVMFSKTVSENVAYGKNKHGKISKEQVKEAIKIAQAEEFILKMDKQYESDIAQGGTNISGGQKQRIAIARAIARKPEIYIFDDSFSALDYNTEKILRHELKKHTKNATNLIVAQRIGTIMNADKILVLDQGKCVGIGTHKQLLKTCKVYKEIALSQLSKEELEHE
jgi:ATP-binding cassette, subfamily B, multidrug efflux pump